MAGSKIRTLLFDDSAFMRKVISDIVSTDESIELVGTAVNGRQCVKMAEELRPDVVITDMIMPDFDGMFVVNSLMEKKPLPIILLSSLEKTDSRIFDALQHGAFEFIDKPANVDQLKIEDYRLLELIKQASNTDITVLKARQFAKKNSSAHTFNEALHYQIVVIGAST